MITRLTFLKQLATLAIGAKALPLLGDKRVEPQTLVSTMPELQVVESFSIESDFFNTKSNIIFCFKNTELNHDLIITKFRTACAGCQVVVKDQYGRTISTTDSDGPYTTTTLLNMMLRSGDSLTFIMSPFKPRLYEPRLQGYHFIEGIKVKR